MAEKENNDIGFSGIGRRIENLKDDISTEDTAAWKQETETPQQTNPEGAKQQSTPKVYVPSSKQKTGSSFRLSFSKVFWGIIAVVIIASMFSQNDDKKKTTYTPSGGTSTPPYSSPASKDDDTVAVGQYRCTRYHYNRSEELKPSIVEKQDIERQQRILKNESDAIDLLKTQIETDYVDNYSQSSVNQHNMLVRDYNSRLKMFRMNVSNMQRKIDNYNAQVNTYNNYLMTNCEMTRE
jgi:hypothetical protein